MEEQVKGTGGGQRRQVGDRGDRWGAISTSGGQVGETGGGTGGWL